MMQQWLMWQWVDSALPSGGAVHSAGLEAAWQAGELPDENALRQFLEASIWQTGASMIPLVGAAARQSSRMPELNARVDALLTNHVANRASRAQARSLLTVARSMLGTQGMSPFGTSGQASAPEHLAPTFGGVLGMVGVSAREVQAAYMFITVRGIVSAAIRLGIIGPMRGQGLQREVSALAELVLDRFETMDADDVASVSPLIDLRQGMQDRLYSRLFQS